LCDSTTSKQFKSGLEVFQDHVLFVKKLMDPEVGFLLGSRMVQAEGEEMLMGWSLLSAALVPKSQLSRTCFLFQVSVEFFARY
jgi:hypothetical protein